MSEEKLTVAELLARRQKEGATSELPRRRRRRSLEEGGVSVQELTGSIPRVKADEPRRGAHALSNSEDDQTTTSDLLADEAENSAAEEAQTAEDAQAAEEAQVTEAQSEAPEQQDQSEDAAESEVAAEDADSSESEVQAEAEPETAEAEVEDAPASQPPAVTVPSVIPMNPRPVMVNSARSEITYTFTELRDMSNDSCTVGEPGPVARAVLTGSNAYDDRPTATIPVVEENFSDATVDSDHSVVGQSDEADSEEAQEEQAREMPQVTSADAVAEPEEAEVLDATDTFEAVETSEAPQAAAATAVVPESAPAEVAPDQTEPEPRDVVKRKGGSAKAADRGDYAEDNSLSVPLLLIQVFVGLIVGALVFLGFTMAWSSLPKVVTIIMALVITGGFAGMANYVRREKDKLTPILAGLVGLTLTFGPWVIFQL
ncbi:hypothetical protein [uncultured Corynebacterium sp.]|uniref:hypothetical protein n=1 Tax=uncultured Corynebacterium sp. TaxID=159447 RepID=UPI0026083D48|nr:hypothetical protein [uncultured Corynebacterium sp.]